MEVDNYYNFSYYTSKKIKENYFVMVGEERGCSKLY